MDKGTRNEEVKNRCGKWDSGKLHVYIFAGRLVFRRILGGRLFDGIKSQIIDARQKKMKSLFVVCTLGLVNKNKLSPF